MPPSPDSRDPGAGGAAPGACHANSPTSRLATGVIISTWPLKTSPTAVAPVRARAASAVTVTVSETSPGPRTMVKLRLAPASR